MNDEELIRPELFNGLSNSKTELLLIRTGYGKYRGTNKYTITPPGLSSELASYLRKKLPKLRCIGLDLISIGSYANRKEGHKAHHAFLNPKKGEPILLLEDVKLDSGSVYSKVIIAPLLIEKIDGSPCTVIGYLNGS